MTPVQKLEALTTWMRLRDEANIAILNDLSRITTPEEAAAAFTSENWADLRKTLTDLILKELDFSIEAGLCNITSSEEPSDDDSPATIPSFLN